MNRAIATILPLARDRPVPQAQTVHRAGSVRYLAVPAVPVQTVPPVGSDLVQTVHLAGPALVQAVLLPPEAATAVLPGKICNVLTGIATRFITVLCRNG
jgi:hypothetical protein